MECANIHVQILESCISQLSSYRDTVSGTHNLKRRGLIWLTVSGHLDHGWLLPGQECCQWKDGDPLLSVGYLEIEQGSVLERKGQGTRQIQTPKPVSMTYSGY